MSEPIYSGAVERLYYRLPETYRMADKATDYTLKRFLSGICSVQGELEQLLARFDRLDLLEQKAKSLTKYSDYNREVWRVVRTNANRNPSFRNTSGTNEIRRNLLTNPNFQTNTTGWATARGSVTREVNDPRFNNFMRFTADGVAGGNYVHSSPRPAVTANESYTTSVYIRAGVTGLYSIDLVWLNSSGGVISTVNGAFVEVGTDWKRLSLTATAPADAATVQVRVLNRTGTMALGATFDVTAFLLETGVALLPYFDGNTINARGLTYTWASTAGASESVATGPRPVNWTAPSAATRAWVDGDKVRFLVTDIITGSTFFYPTAMLPPVEGNTYAHRITATVESSSPAPAPLRVAHIKYGDTFTSLGPPSIIAPGDSADLFMSGNEYDTASTTGGRLAMYRGNNDSLVPGTEFYLTRALSEVTSSLTGVAGEYFDGSMANDYFSKKEWTGTPDDSPSTLSQKKEVTSAEEAAWGWAPIDVTSDLTDPMTADSAWLEWMGQLVGVDTAPLRTEQERRDAVRFASSGFHAGSTSALEDAVRSELTGSRYVRIYSHSTSDFIGTGTQWDVLIVTKVSETPPGADVVNTVIRKGAKPAGVRLWHRSFEAPFDVTDTLTWDQRDSMSWNEVEEYGV